MVPNFEPKIDKNYCSTPIVDTFLIGRLPIPQKIVLASFCPLRFCEFQIFGGHFLTPTKESEQPRMAKMGLFALAFTSTGRYLSSVTLPVYLLHPNLNIGSDSVDHPEFTPGDFPPTEQPMQKLKSRISRRFSISVLFQKIFKS